MYYVLFTVPIRYNLYGIVDLSFHQLVAPVTLSDLQPSNQYIIVFFKVYNNYFFQSIDNPNMF